MLRILLAVLFLLVAVPSPLALAQPETAEAPAAAIPDTPVGRQLAWFIGRLSGGESGDTGAHLAEAFKAAIPPDTLDKQLQVVAASLLGGGPARLVGLDPGATDHALSGRVRSEANGVTLAFRLAVEPETGLITYLTSQVIPGDSPTAAETWEELDKALQTRPGTIALYAGEVGEDASLIPIHAFNPDARLAIGSTFKLYILGALAKMVASGETAWDHPLALRDEFKSLPSGTMQLEPAGTTYPISHYALKMISISDNTATDHLLHFVGRERVERFMGGLNADPARSLPFLTTREMFTMKLGEDRTLADRYIAAGVEERRAMLESAGEVGSASPSMMLAAVWRKPMWIDTLEWFATPEECCRLIAQVDALGARPGGEPARAAMRANAGIGFDSTVWKDIAFKGGSEPGVICLTWLMARDDGRRFTLTLVWNDPESEVDHAGAIDLAGQAIRLLSIHDR